MAFPALLIFQQSMRKHRVRTTHVLRVWVYSVPQLLPIAAAVAYAWDCILAVTRIPMNPDLEWLIAGPVWLHVLICLSLAYRVYLRIPHAWGVAIASQVIAILIAITLLAVVFVVLG